MSYHANREIVFGHSMSYDSHAKSLLQYHCGIPRQLVYLLCPRLILQVGKGSTLSFNTFPTKTLCSGSKITIIIGNNIIEWAFSALVDDTRLGLKNSSYPKKAESRIH